MTHARDPLSLTVVLEANLANHKRSKPTGCNSIFAFLELLVLMAVVDDE